MWIGTTSDDGRALHLNFSQIQRIEYSDPGPLRIKWAKAWFADGSVMNFSRPEAATNLYMMMEKLIRDGAKP